MPEKVVGINSKEMRSPSITHIGTKGKGKKCRKKNHKKEDQSGQVLA